MLVRGECTVCTYITDDTVNTQANEIEIFSDINITVPGRRRSRHVWAGRGEMGVEQGD
jgi:hypothetical protein